MTATPDSTGPLTLDDVTRLAEANGGLRFELSRGRLIVLPVPNWRHQAVGGILAAWFLGHGFRGRVNLAPGVRTATDSLNGRIPDLVVTRAPVSNDTVWLRPDVVLLAVEIVSKGSERTDRWLKPLEYAVAGIPRFWRVEPDDTVVRLRLEDGRYVEEGSPLRLDDLLAGEVPDLT